MTTMLGDFDIAQLWYHGTASVFFFTAATVICHICLLNLLIAIVSHEFDEYMLSAGWPIIRGFVQLTLIVIVCAAKFMNALLVLFSLKFADA